MHAAGTDFSNFRRAIAFSNISFLLIILQVSRFEFIADCESFGGAQSARASAKRGEKLSAIALARVICT